MKLKKEIERNKDVQRKESEKKENLMATERERERE